MAVIRGLTTDKPNLLKIIRFYEAVCSSDHLHFGQETVGSDPRIA